MVSTIKFSEFTNQGNLANGEITVGIGPDGNNAYYNNPWTFLPSGTTAERPVPAPAMYGLLRFNTDLQQYEYYDYLTPSWVQVAAEGGNTILTVTVTTGGALTAVPNTIYIIKAASEVIITLPAAVTEGQLVGVRGYSATSYNIICPGSQVVYNGLANTSAGGSLTPENRYDSIDLTCVDANASWIVSASVSSGFALS